MVLATVSLRRKEMKKIIEIACGKLCPIVAELRHDVANRDTEIRRLESLRSRDRLKINELEGRIAKARQALFGILCAPKITGGP